MCGIAALFAYRDDSPAVTLAELLAINQAMVRRGPDGGGSWISDDNRVGLAHRRLAIIDLSDAAAQPMAVGERYRITYNGEIYNFRALRRELEQAGVAFTTESDTEVILRLYERDGPDMVDRLRGMYALAIWDETKRGLFLARDSLGIKPLYYADDGKTFRVASQVKALLAGERVDTAPDPAGHAGFFLFGHVPEPHTLYRRIKALPAGHRLWVDAGGGAEPEPFFDVTALLAENGDIGAAADLGEALRDSVEHHLVADVPVGVFLSSGLDSATLAGLAAECHGAGLETVTLGFEEFEGSARDEVPLAERVAALYGTHHRTERIAQLHFEGALPDILAAMDQPTIDGVNTYFVARAAKHAGLKVALSGLGGDELFGGYDSFEQIPRLAGTLGAIPGLGAVGSALRAVGAPVLKSFTSPKYAGLFEYGTTYGGAYLLRRGLYMPWELPQVMDPDMAGAGWRGLEPRLRLENAHRPIDEPRRKVAALEMTQYMRNQLLRDADWAGMAHSLEIRVPLVDATLLRSLAPALGRPGGPDKRAMALTPETPLPDALLERAKTGFFVPVVDWLGGAEGIGARGYRGWAKKVYRSLSLSPA